MGFSTHGGVRGTLKNNFTEDERRDNIIAKESNNTWRYTDRGGCHRVTYRHHNTDILSVELEDRIDTRAFKKTAPQGRACWAKIDHHASKTTSERMSLFTRRHGVPVSVGVEQITQEIPLHRSMIPFAAVRVAHLWVKDLTPHPKHEGFFLGYRGAVLTISVPVNTFGGVLQNIEAARRAFHGYRDSESSSSPLEDLRSFMSNAYEPISTCCTVRVAGKGLSRQPYKILGESTLMSNSSAYDQKPTVFSLLGRTPVSAALSYSALDRKRVNAANAVLNWVNPRLKLGDHVAQVTLSDKNYQGYQPNTVWQDHFTFHEPTAHAEFVTAAGYRGNTPVYEACLDLRPLAPALRLLEMTLSGTETVNSTNEMTDYAFMAEHLAKLKPYLVDYDRNEVPAPDMLEALLKQWPTNFLMALARVDVNALRDNAKVIRNPLLFISMDPNHVPTLKKDSSWARDV